MVIKKNTYYLKNSNKKQRPFMHFLISTMKRKPTQILQIWVKCVEALSSPFFQDFISQNDIRQHL